MDVCLWLILLVGLIMCIEFQNTSADPDITTLHVGDVGRNQCSIKIKMPDITTKLRGVQGKRGGEGSKGQRGLVGDEGFAGEKGDKGQKGLNVTGDKGEKGDKGLKGETGFDGEIGYPGSKGAKGEKGVKGMRYDGIKGVKGRQGLNGTESGEPGDDGPSGDKGDNGDTGSIGRKGLDGPLGNHCIMRLMDTDTDTETTCDSILEALGYYDDVDVSKGFDIACDDDTSEVCIRETKDTSLINHKAENFWLSDVGIDVRNIYGLKSKQIYWLKKKSISIRQTIIYNCENSIAFSKANVSKSIQLLSWNEKLIGPIATKTLPLNYVVPEATNQCADRTSGTSHIVINSNNTNRLPITDIRINDIRDTTQKVSVKNLELCFKWK